MNGFIWVKHDYYFTFFFHHPMYVCNGDGLRIPLFCFAKWV